MRLAALIPVVLCAAALVLSFLCLFAGSSQGFMEDYALVTLNTSRFGASVLNTSTHHSSNPLLAFLDNLTNTIETDINNDINSLAKDLGLRDFYSAHLLDYCEGFYVPGPVPNATLSSDSISKNVTFCSNKTSMYTFDPETTLANELDRAGHHNINLTALHWPSEIGTGLATLRAAQMATFVLYCIGIAFIGVALILSLVGVFLEGRANALLNVAVDWIGFLAIGIATAIATAVIVKATDLINHYGADVGINAVKGGKFLALTWVATALMLVASLVWCFDCIVGRRTPRARRTKAYGA